MKMNKKIGRILAITMMIVVMVALSVAPVFATGNDPKVKPGDSFTAVTGKNDAIDTVKSVGGVIVTTISTIGSMGSIIFLIILGLKYMMGSAEERAEYKKTLMPYFIGALMVFGASALAGVIYNIAGSIPGAAGTTNPTASIITLI